MTPSEAHSIIYDFMLPVTRVPNCDCKYYESLDNLVPVWEKLGKHLFLEFCRHDVNDYHWATFCDNNLNIDEDTVMVTIQQAAAIATAKAIRELSSE